MQVRKAVSVLPDPVGAAIRVCRPWAMAGQPAAWASVGSVEPAAEPPLNDGVEGGG